MRQTETLSAETRRILSLAWPVALTSLNWTIIQVTDIVVVGMTGTDEAAAFGASRTLTFVAIMMGFGFLTGVLVHAARAEGAGDTRATGRTLHHGVMLALVLGAGMAAGLWAFAQPLLLAIGVDPGIAPAGAAVVQVMALAYPGQLASIAASFFLEGVSRPRRVMVVNLSVLPINALLAWAWSGGHLGFPEWHAVGAAAATAVTSVIGAVAMVAAAVTLPDGRARGVREWRASLPGAARGAGALLAFGLMPALASALELGGFSILIALSTRLGEAATHAFQIVFSIHNIAFGIALGLGSAAGVRVGNAVGEGRPEAAPRRTAIAAGIAALVAGTLAACALLARGPLVAAFPATAEVHLLAATMLLLWAPFILFDAVQIVVTYALRSLGDQVAAGFNNIAAFFVLTGGLGIWLVHIGWGPIALVTASASGMVAAAILNGARLIWVTGPRFRPRS